MAINALKTIRIVTFTALGLWHVGQPIDAISAAVSEAKVSLATVQKDDSKDSGGDQVAVQFSREEVDSITKALPEGEARQIFKEKVIKSEEKDDASFDESLRSGEELSLLFFDGEKAFSRAQERLVSFFTKPTSTIDTREWGAAFDNLNLGRGFGHLVLTLFIATLFVFLGLAVEWLVRRSTESLRRQILDAASLGRLHLLGRVLSRLLLNILGMSTYILTTFVLWAIFYDEGDPGYAILSFVLLPSYYIRFFMLAANLVLSPATPVLRLFPLPDEDAKFLYRWTIAIVVTAIAIADIAYLFLGAGISRKSFLFIYSLSGLSVSFLMVLVIWQSRRRVARAIWPEAPAGDQAAPSLRARFARSWHWFAITYVIGMGFFWFIKGLDKGEIAVLSTIISVFLIPLLIGISSWAERLLDIASGLSPSSFISPDTDIPQSLSDPESPPSEAADDQVAGTKSYLLQHLPLIKIILRILLVALLFFIILRLWGIDLPLGRLFTSTALNIMGLLLLSIVIWQFTKARIDRKIREEMPDDDEEMEEGGRGGSRIGTLLVLLRKFILSVLFVIVSLIILSSLGLDIGPVLLSKIKSQGVRQMDDSAMILLVKFKTPPGEQFVVRREVYKRIQERFREEGIEFAHRNVTVYLPQEDRATASDNGQQTGSTSDKRLLEAGAAAVAASQFEKAEDS